MHVGQPEIAPAEPVGQLGVINAEQVQHRDMQVMCAGEVFYGTEKRLFVEPYLLYRWELRHLLANLYPCAVDDSFFHLRMMLRLGRVDRIKLRRLVCPR